MLLNLPSKGSDFIVLFLNDAVEPFALLSQDLNLILTVEVKFFSHVFVLGNSFPEFFVLIADNFELVLKLAHLACRKTKILLNLFDFIIQGIVLSHEFLHFYTISF